MEIDQRLMRRAIELARRHAPRQPFAAVLADRTTGHIAAEGWNRIEVNPTWHGEIDVINAYARRTRATRWHELVLVTTAEPCAMCQGAILWAGIPRVVYGLSIAGLVELGWDQIALSAEEVTRRAPFAHCEIVGDVLVDECARLFRDR